MRLGLFLLFASILAPPLRAESVISFPWLAFGDIRGHISPCGCDPTTDMGGIQRVARLVETDRSQFPDLWLFSLGNNLPREGEDLKASTLLRSESILRPVATLLNRTELERFQQVRQWQKEFRLPQPYYLLSNNARNTADVNFARIFKEVVVLGFTEHPTLTLPWGPRVREQWERFLKNHPSKTKVLLFSGSDDTLAHIQKSKMFDLIISSNTAALSETPTAAERDQPGLLLRRDDVYMVPSFGQGVLRGGVLRQAKPLHDLLTACVNSKEPSCQPKGASDGGLVAGDKIVTWLDKAWEGTSELSPLLATYQDEANGQFEKKALERGTQLAATPYAGSESCRTCHEAAYNIWKQTKHAEAFKILVAKQKNKDLDCVGCHVLGFNTPGGFASEELSPQFKDVNCENCHGPRLAHTKNPTIKPTGLLVQKAICAQCHVREHSPQFNYERYWQQIKHGK